MSRARALALVVTGLLAGVAAPTAVAAVPALACTGFGSTWTPVAGSSVTGAVGTPLTSTVIGYDSGLNTPLTLDSVSPDPATLGLTVTSRERTTAGITSLDIQVAGTPSRAGTQQLTFTVGGAGVDCGAGTEAAAFDFVFAQGAQSITLPAPAADVRAGQSLVLSASATSGLPVTYVVPAAAAAVCSVTGSTVSFLDAGTCTVEAAQAGSADWLAAPAATITYAVLGAEPAVAPPPSPVDPAPELADTGLPISPSLWLAGVLAALGGALLLTARLARRPASSRNGRSNR